MSERTTVRLPEELLKRAKRKAAAEGRTLTSLIEDGLRLVTAEQKTTRPVRRILPPVSKAKGGLLPGIDLTSFSAFEEAEDLAYLARRRRSK
jgi:CopG antitoxin of type II toxin-antitoxin system